MLRNVEPSKCGCMEFYIAASVFLLLAIIAATGKIDSLYCKKYGPGFKNGKFTLFKPIKYNPKRMRPLFVAMLTIMGFLVLAIPMLGLPEHVMAILIFVIAVVSSAIALTWAVEKD